MSYNLFNQALAVTHLACFQSFVFTNKAAEALFVGGWFVLFWQICEIKFLGDAESQAVCPCHVDKLCHRSLNTVILILHLYRRCVRGNKAPCDSSFGDSDFKTAS